VIGASIAGMLAARVLSEQFDRVVVLERDRELDGERRSVPQAQHLHGLLAGGLRAIDALFPGFAAGAEARGAISVDIGSFATWFIDGVALPRVETGLRGLLMSRPAFELYLRSLLRQRANVRIEPGVRAAGLLGSAWGITGVRLENDHTLACDLVVDASGRHSELPRWLAGFGLPAPEQERVQMELSYTSCLVRRKREHLAGELGYLWLPTAPTLRAGAALAVEHERFIVTLMGYLGERAPRNFAGMVEYARTLPVPGLYELLRDAEPLTEPVQLRDPASLRWRYEQLKHIPPGVLAIGDALCSVNPSYGHGMTLAALEALCLARALEGAARSCTARYFSAVARIIDVPWSMVVGADFEFEGVTGNTPPPPPTIRAYFKRALRAAQVDRDVAIAVYRVMHLVDPPSALFTPALLASVAAYESSAAQASLMLLPES
jgi:2-polyprenyl-6-methoxyphenol hydroxylase-like FAD-dependent oxidoreductase